MIATPGPPGTRITRAKVKPRGHKARFRFKATHAIPTGFKCKLTRRGAHGRRGHFRHCSSPKTYRHLRPGRYMFKVRARGTGGVDRTAAKSAFKIRG